MKIVRNLSRGRSPCQRVNHVKSGVIYFSAFIFSYDTIHVSGTIHTRDRDLTKTRNSKGSTGAHPLPLRCLSQFFPDKEKIDCLENGVFMHMFAYILPMG